jgi:hypothetical protein
MAPPRARRQRSCTAPTHVGRREGLSDGPRAAGSAGTEGSYGGSPRSNAGASVGIAPREASVSRGNRWGVARGGPRSGGSKAPARTLERGVGAGSLPRSDREAWRPGAWPRAEGRSLGVARGTLRSPDRGSRGASRLASRPATPRIRCGTCTSCLGCAALCRSALGRIRAPGEAVAGGTERYRARPTRLRSARHASPRRERRRHAPRLTWSAEVTRSSSRRGSGRGRPPSAGPGGVTSWSMVRPRSTPSSDRYGATALSQRCEDRAAHSGPVGPRPR